MNHSTPAEDHALVWAPVAEYPAHCPGSPADRLWLDYRSRSEIALGVDTSMLAGQVPSFAL